MVISTQSSSISSGKMQLISNMALIFVVLLISYFEGKYIE